MRESKSLAAKKAKTKFLNDSLEALHESEIISGAKKMIDSR